MAFVALAGPIARIIGLEPWHIGAAMTVSGVAWVLMARFWGGLSDERGRRPVLLIGLAGFAFSYALLSLFIDLALRLSVAPMIAFIGLLVGRAIAGGFYAGVPAISAAFVADHTPADKRAAAMAALGASSATGMVIGPGLAGLIAPYSLILPFYLTAALPACALVAIWYVLPREPGHKAKKKSALKLLDPRLRRPMLVAFVASFSVAVAQITVGFLALDRLRLAAADAAQVAGIALAIVGGALIVSQMILRRLTWTPQRFIAVGALVAAVGFGSVMLVHTAMSLWLSFGVAAMGMGWIYPSVAALTANMVAKHEQGAAAGTIGSAQGMGTIAGPLVGTTVYAVENSLPYALIAMMLLGVAFMLSKMARLPSVE